MRRQLITSLQSLSNWVDKILSGGKREMNLNTFLDTYNIEDLQKFYKEMEQFVKEIAKELPQCQKLIDEFVENEKKLDIESKRQSISLCSIFNNDFSIFQRRSSKDLVFVLSQIRDNVENLIYQVKINIE